MLTQIPLLLYVPISGSSFSTDLSSHVFLTTVFETLKFKIVLALSSISIKLVSESKGVFDAAVESNHIRFASFLMLRVAYGFIANGITQSSVCGY